MPCGEKYKSLIVTASGLNLSQPYGKVATDSDYEEWYDLADHLVKTAVSRFDALGEIEGEKAGVFTKWNALVEIKNRMVFKFHELPSGLLYFGGWSWADEIGEAQRVIADAVCLMERADAGILSYGGEVPVTPSVTPSPDLDKPSPAPPWLKWSVIGAGIIGATLVATSLIVKVAKKSPRQNPSRRRLKSSKRREGIRI